MVSSAFTASISEQLSAKERDVAAFVGVIVVVGVLNEDLGKWALILTGTGEYELAFELVLYTLDTRGIGVAFSEVL